MPMKKQSKKPVPKSVKRGRPPAKKSRPVFTRVTEDEHADLVESAESYGVKLAEFVRWHLADAAKGLYVPQALRLRLAK